MTPSEDVRPSIPMSEAALLTNSKDEPSLGAELRAEIDTADEADLLCAFVKWHGLRLLEPQLRRLRTRGSPCASSRRPIWALPSGLPSTVWSASWARRSRCSTTHSAPGCTQRRGCSVDTPVRHRLRRFLQPVARRAARRCRVERTALTGGTPSLLEKFHATFDTYWNDSSFELYDPDRDRDRLDDALAEASGAARHSRVTITLSGLEVRPFNYQQEMLDAIAAERNVHGRHRNLVVAATGTGKTVVAALDYRRLCTAQVRPRLLFVAHRREILEQSLRTYREVLADENFGELYVGGTRPERWDHVFASVQSLTSYGVEQPAGRCLRHRGHRRVSSRSGLTYRRLIERLTPRELLGLTATPSGPTARRSRLLRRANRRGASTVGCTRGRPPVPLPLLRSG